MRHEWWNDEIHLPKFPSPPMRNGETWTYDYRRERWIKLSRLALLRDRVRRAWRVLANGDQNGHQPSVTPRVEP